MRYLVNVSCLCALLLSVAFGQADRGTVTGTVTDPSGAVVAGARVSAENMDTHNVVQTRTTSTGNFTLPQLPVGMWDVTVEAPGFSKYFQKNIRLVADQTATIDVQLKVGSTADTMRR